jgi:hypothetical protein
MAQMNSATRVSLNRPWSHLAASPGAPLFRELVPLGTTASAAQPIHRCPPVALHLTPPSCPSTPAIKRPRPRRQIPLFLLHFPLPPKLSSAAAQRRLAGVSSRHFSIPCAQRVSLTSQCFCPHFCSSSFTPPTSTPDHAVDLR